MPLEKLTTRIPIEVFEALSARAAELGLTLSAFSAQVLERAVRESDLEVSPEAATVPDERRVDDVITRLEALIAAWSAQRAQSAAVVAQGGTQGSHGPVDTTGDAPDPVAFMIESLMIQRALLHLVGEARRTERNVVISETIRQTLGPRKRWQL